MPKHTAASLLARACALLATHPTFRADVDEFLRYADAPVLEHRSMPAQEPKGQAVPDRGRIVPSPIAQEYNDLVEALRQTGFIHSSGDIPRAVQILIKALRGRRYRPEQQGLAWT